jgi:hypothetical protein
MSVSRLFFIIIFETKTVVLSYNKDDMEVGGGNMVWNKE